MDIPTLATILPTLDRPEERDLRVLACASGIDRLSRANLLTPYETTVAMKLALRTLLLTTRAPIAMIHQVRGLLNELEREQAHADELSA
jgi:hypothetical protein